MPEMQYLDKDITARFAEEFLNGKVLLFNKPLYWTSFDLVNKVKAILRNRLALKKIKIGHAGTLDPLATGLMVICTGKETRNIEKYQSQSKKYSAQICLGATTPSYDLETNVNATFPVEHIDQSLVEKTLESFKGNQLQLPPDYSARFVKGKRAYELARKGESVELEAREICIYDISLVNCHIPYIEVNVTCSKGTYIRSLARDIGKRLNSGAYLSGLIRTGIGEFSVDHAMKVEEFERNFVLL